CSGCHSFSGAGGDKGPDLRDYSSRGWILSILREPDGPLRMGPCKLQKGMKPVQGTAEEIAALAELVYAQSGASVVDRALVARGARSLEVRYLRAGDRELARRVLFRYANDGAPTEARHRTRLAPGRYEVLMSIEDAAGRATTRARTLEVGGRGEHAYLDF